MTHTLISSHVELSEQSIVIEKTELGFFDVLSKHSMAIEIGLDLLEIDPTDTIPQIHRKIAKASRFNQDHLIEIMLAGLMSIVVLSETKQETVDSFVYAIGLTDQILSQ